MTKNFTRSELGIYSTISEQLRRARELHKLTLDQCANATSIQKKYLQALENGQFDVLPGELYTRAWIKKYATLLTLPLDELMISYDKEVAIRKKIDRETTKTQQPADSWFWGFFTLRRIAVLSLIAVVVGYMSFVAYQTVRSPRVELNIPLQGFRTLENSIILKGRTESGAQVMINQQPIILDADNMFTQNIGLKNGLNTVTIEARKKFSRTYRQSIMILKTTPPALEQATTTGPL